MSCVVLICSSSSAFCASQLLEPRPRAHLRCVQLLPELFRCELRLLQFTFKPQRGP